MALLGIGERVHLGTQHRHGDAQPAGRPGGAGAGVYNATRQVGAVLGSAAIAVFMDSRLSGQGLNTSASEGGGTGKLPAQVLAPFSSAMREAVLLPTVRGASRTARRGFFERPRHEGYAGAPGVRLVQLLVQSLRPTPDPHHQRQQAEHQHGPHTKAPRSVNGAVTVMRAGRTTLTRRVGLRRLGVAGRRG